MNIYVSHLNFATKDDSLLNLFAEYGEVSSASIIMDRETGRSRGFGFVKMPNDAEGRKAIEALNDTEFEGKVIGVNIARPITERSHECYNRGGGYTRGGGGYGSR